MFIRRYRCYALFKTRLHHVKHYKKYLLVADCIPSSVQVTGSVEFSEFLSESSELHLRAEPRTMGWTLCSLLAQPWDYSPAKKKMVVQSSRHYFHMQEQRDLGVKQN